MAIELKIVESGLFDFSDGYLGSTNHCVNYYYGYDENNINEIIDENDLKNLKLNWSGFEEWFNDCYDGFEIIEDIINGGRGYGKMIVDKVNKSINIMVVPCLFNNNGNEVKIFGFNNDGKLVREINNEKLIEMLKEGYYIG
jgi:hypothetical protein